MAMAKTFNVDLVMTFVHGIYPIKMQYQENTLDGLVNLVSVAGHQKFVMLQKVDQGI